MIRLLRRLLDLAATHPDDGRALAAIITLTIIVVGFVVVAAGLLASSFWYLGVVLVAVTLYRLVRYALVGR